MKLNEKLESLGIDTKADKALVSQAKEALLNAGCSVKSLASVLDSNQEMIINQFFAKKNLNTSAETKNEEKKEEKPIKRSDLPFWKKDNVKVASNLSASGKFSKESIKKFDNKTVEKDTKKGNPLPQATLEAIKKQKIDSLNKANEDAKKNKIEVDSKNIQNENDNHLESKNINNKKSNDNIIQKQNDKNNITQNKQLNDNSKNNNIKENKQYNAQQNHTNNQFNKLDNRNDNKQKFRPDNRQNNNKNVDFQNKKININFTKDRKDDKRKFFDNKDNRNQQSNPNGQNKNQNQFQKDRKQQFNSQNGSKKNLVLNKSNADTITGTNNRFVGKERDKNKYNKDQLEQKKTQNKAKLKQGKGGNKNLQNYNVEEKAHTRLKNKNGKGAFIRPEIKDIIPEETIKSIKLPDFITVKELSSMLKLQPAVIVKKLFLAGKMVTPNTELSYEEAEDIAIEYDILCEKEEKVDVIAELLKENEEDESTMLTRPPVVCVMGHVDHGKTSILDAIRKTNVTQKEAGGITQAIGAYQVKINDRNITFLDTPGHEAFTQMRMRGANSTDIAVLVVAADDGVMPQTIEAINHAKAAKVEIVVAVNKIDKEEANIQRVKEELSKYDLVPSDWGGNTTFVPVSAKKGIGITELLEMILLTADVLDLKANPNRNARGVVIEAELDKGKGPVARVLVQKGTLHTGDHVAMGACYGKVRAMMDYTGMKVKEAGPSMPVEILGLSDVPNAGDVMIAFDSEKQAKEFAATFIAENKQKMVEASKQKVSLEDIGAMIKSGDLKELPIVLKADVIGSVEAVKDSLEKLSNDEVKVKVIHSGVGNVNESDATLASASNAIIIAFNVKHDSNAKSIIEREKVDFRQYDIIYNAIEEVERAIKGLQAPVYVEKIIGHATIRQIFKSSGVGQIAGSYVEDGYVQRNAKVRLFRGKDLIYTGSIDTLKRFKDDVKEVKTGFECGIVFDDFTKFEVNDSIEAFIMELKKDE